MNDARRKWFGWRHDCADGGQEILFAETNVTN
jgi:hypothetical protein